ncbi:Protein YIM1 [Candida viswanathii]|uniref:Protein YIM1 n=1 Tax=Candida viswanathii TaxID=5486 RepID=A0A367XM37_9ASCO|nr:Protein YIM1 [Candida viswanathii]
MPTLPYKRWTFKFARTPLEITSAKFNFPTNSHGEFVIPKNDILVKIHYASLNPVDNKMKHMSLLPSFSNKGMGKDYSGEIVALGSNVKKLQVGDYVQGFHPGVLSSDGTFSEYLLINTKLFMFKTEVATVPENTTLEQAASWPLVLGTALLLTDKLPLKGKKVLVLGGATSVGRYLTQLLKIEGASDIVVSCSPRSQELIEELGATKVINYRENVLNQVLENVKDKPFDYIFDCWGGNALFPEINHVLVKGGAYRTTVGDNPGHGALALIRTHLKSLLRGLASKLHLINYRYSYVLLGNKNPGWIDRAVQYIASGKMKIFIDKVYDFEDLPEAIEFIETGKAQGKLVIKVEDEK